MERLTVQAEVASDPQLGVHESIEEAMCSNKIIRLMTEQNGLAADMIGAIWELKSSKFIKMTAKRFQICFSNKMKFHQMFQDSLRQCSNLSQGVLGID